MKNLSLLIISILALSIFSCQREEVQKNGESITITATQPGLPDLKTNIGGVGTVAVTWNAADKLAVFDATGDNVNKEFPCSGGSETQTGTFTGPISNWEIGQPKTFNAVYPYDIFKGEQTYGSYQFNIPSTQTQDFTSEATKYAHLGQYDFMAASPVTVNKPPIGLPAINFSFQHLFAILDIEVTNSTGGDFTVTSISIQRVMAEFTTYAQLDLSKSPGDPGFYLSMMTWEQLDLDVSNNATPTASGSVFTGSLMIAPVDLSGGYTNFVVTAGGKQYTVTKNSGPNVAAGKRYKAKITISAPDFTDSRDGKVYKAVKIGTQTWMAENLAWLPAVVGQATYSNSVIYYYVYGYNGTDKDAAKATDNYKTYGVLYNWKAALAACPAGWHLPTDAEFTTLTTFLGGGGVAGGPLKETGTTHWTSQSAGATNSSGFTALPGGFSASFGIYGLRDNAYFWSASEDGASNAWYRNLYYLSDEVFPDNGVLNYGFSVRCLQNP